MDEVKITDLYLNVKTALIEAWNDIQKRKVPKPLYWDATEEYVNKREGFGESVEQLIKLFFQKVRQGDSKAEIIKNFIHQRYHWEKDNKTEEILSAMLYLTIRKDDKRAEELLCAFYRERLIFFIREKIGHVKIGDVEDLVHDILKKFLEQVRSGEFDIRGRPVGVHLYYLKQDRLKKYLKTNPLEKVEEEIEELINNSDDIDTESKKIIKDCISGLIEPHRTMIRKKYWENASSKEIANEMMLEPSQVDNKLSYARDLIEECINKI